MLSSTVRLKCFQFFSWLEEKTWVEKDICSLKRGNSVKLMKNLVKGPEMRPREFLSLILILTSKTDQEFCSHHFNVNLRSLGPKMADLPLFSRNGPVDGA